MVALLWQQGDARGTLNLPASTKVEDLKLRLNASDCDAVMFDAVIIEVRKAGSVLKRKLDTQKQDAFNCAGPPLGNRLCACAQSGDLALEGCISSLTGSLPLGHEGRGQASPVVHSWQPRSKARGPGELWCGWEAVLKLRARTKDAGPTLNVLQLPTPKVN